MVANTNSRFLTNGSHLTKVPSKQRSYQRWLDKRIYKTEMKFWAVLGSQGCREKKKLPTATSMQLFGVVFQLFVGKTKFIFLKKYYSARTEKLRKIFKNEYRLKIGYIHN